MGFVSHLFAELLATLGRVLLSVSAALLLEELTWGGLARLLLTPRREVGRNSCRVDQQSVRPVRLRSNQ